jgi:small subunit ribosomal protein S6
MARSTVSTSGSAGQARRAREYETIYILRPSVNAEDADKVSRRLTDVVSGLQGKLIKLDSWGWRRLAYPIKGETRGVFIYARYAGYDDVVAEIERNLRLLEPVVRFQTVLLNPRVNMEEIQVDPADIELEPLGQSDLEEDITIAQRLGLMERQPHPRAAEVTAPEPEQQPAPGTEPQAESEQAESAQAESKGDESEAEGKEAKAEPEPATDAKAEPEPATDAKTEPEPATDAKTEPAEGENEGTEESGNPDREPEAGTA